MTCFFMDSFESRMNPRFLAEHLNSLPDTSFSLIGAVYQKYTLNSLLLPVCVTCVSGVPLASRFFSFYCY